METHTLAPCGIAARILPGVPCLACTVHEVLRAEDVGGEENLRIFYTSVHVAFCSKVHNHVKVMLCKKVRYKGAITNVATHKKASLVVYVVFYGAKVAGVCKRVQHHDFYVRVLAQHILYEICADESGGSRNKIRFHVFLFMMYV